MMKKKSLSLLLLVVLIPFLMFVGHSIWIILDEIVKPGNNNFYPINISTTTKKVYTSEPQGLDVDVDFTDTEYDENFLSFEYFEYKDGITIDSNTGFVKENDKFVYEAPFYSRKIKNVEIDPETNEEIISYTLSEKLPENAGQYYVLVLYGDKENNEDKEIISNVLFTIQKRKLRLTWVIDSTNITNSNYSTTYNALSHTPTGSIVSETSEAYINNGYGIIAGDTVSLSTPKYIRFEDEYTLENEGTSTAINAGDYKVTYELEGNHKDNYEIYNNDYLFSINKATLSVTLKDKETTYGDSFDETTFFSESDIVSFTGFKGNDDESCIDTLEDGSYGAVFKTVYDQFYDAKTYSYYVEDITSQNYLFEYSGSLKVNKRDIEYMFDDFSNRRYNGTYQKPTALIKGEFARNEDKFEIDAENVIVDGDATKMSIDATNYVASVKQFHKNYNLVLEGSGNFTILPRILVINWDSLTLERIYDGSEQEPTINFDNIVDTENRKDSLTVVQTYLGTFNGAAVTSALNATTYTVTVNFTADEGTLSTNYILPEDPGFKNQFTISPKGVTLVWSNTSDIIYGDKNGGRIDKTPTAQFKSGDILNNDSVDLAYTKQGNLVDNKAIDAGNYSVDASIIGDYKENYYIEYHKLEDTTTDYDLNFTIAKRGIKIVKPSDDSSNYIYDGTPKVPNYTYPYSSDESGEYFVVSGDDSTSLFTGSFAGVDEKGIQPTQSVDGSEIHSSYTYTVSLTELGNKNYYLVGEISFLHDIRKASLNGTDLIHDGHDNGSRRLTTKTSLNTIYDGNIQKPYFYVSSAALSTVDKNLTFHASVKVTQNDAEVDPINAGSYDFKVESLLGTTAGGYNVSDCYELVSTLEDAYIIEQRTVSLTWENTTFTYNNDYQYPSVVLGNIVQGEELDYTLTSESKINKNAANYVATIDSLTEKEGSISSTLVSNYKLPSLITCDYVINPYKLTIKANDYAPVYGDALSSAGITYIGENNKTGEDAFAGSGENKETSDVLEGVLAFDYSYERYQDIGENDYILTPKGLSNSNYAISYSSGDLSVQKREILLNWNNTSFVFNNDYQYPTISLGNTVNGDINNLGYELTSESKSNMNASDTPYVAEVSLLTGKKAENYKLPEIYHKEFNISKFAFTVTTNDASIIYGDAPANNGVVYSSSNGVGDNAFAGSGEKKQNVSIFTSLDYEYTYNQFDDVGNGKYVITPTGYTYSNYDITVKKGVLNVSKKDVTLSYLETKVDYDAENHMPTYDQNAFNSYKVINKSTNTVDDLGVVITYNNSLDGPINAGYYSANATLSGSKKDNYNLTNNGTNFTINKVKLTVTLNDRDLIYGDNPNENHAGYNLSGFVGNETAAVLSGSLVYSYNYSQFGKIGTYEINASGYESNNYYFEYVKSNLTVSARPIEVTIANKESKYGEDIVELTSSITSGSLARDSDSPYAISTLATNTSNVGTYAISGTTIDTNYSITFIDGVYTINRAINIISVNKEDVVVTYGDEITLPIASAIFGDVSIDKEEMINVGDYYVVYSVEESMNYTSATETIKVIINPLSVSEPTVSGTYTYNEQEQTVVLNGFDATYMSVSNNKQTNAGKYTVKVTLDSNHIWADGSDGNIAWNIAKANVSITVSDLIVDYDGNVHSIVATTNSDGNITYTNNDKIIAGTYTVAIKVSEGTNHLAGQTTAQLIIERVTPTVTITNSSYNSETNTITSTYGSSYDITSSCESDGEKTITYYNSNDEIINKPTNVGDYYAVISISQGTNHLATTKTVNIKINPISIVGSTISSVADQEYTGSAITPSITVTLANGQVLGSANYNVAYSNNVNAGQATITVTGKGNYSGTITSTFIITALDISDAIVVVNGSYVYTGSTIIPSVTVTLDGKVLEKDKDYVLSGQNNIDVTDSALIIVKGINGYTNSVDAVFTISQADPLTFKDAKGNSILEIGLAKSIYYEYQGSVPATDFDFSYSSDYFSSTMLSPVSTTLYYGGVASTTYANGYTYDSLALAQAYENTVVFRFSHDNPNFINDIEQSITVKVHPVAYVGSTYFGTVEKAMGAIQNTTGAIRVHIIPGTNPIVKSNIVIPANVTMVLPYENETWNGRQSAEATGTSPTADSPGKWNKTSNDIPSIKYFADSTLERINTYRKNNMTLADNVTITNNGNLYIGGVIGHEGQGMSGHTSGNYTQITLGSKSGITNYGIIKCYGYIKETSDNNQSFVNNISGTIEMPFVIYDFKGGSITAGLYKNETVQVTPFEEYDMPNIQAKITTYSAATILGLFDLYTGETSVSSVGATMAARHNTDEANIIASSNALFTLTSGYATLKYTPAYLSDGTPVTVDDGVSGITEFRIRGNIALSSMTIALNAAKDVTWESSLMETLGSSTVNKLLNTEISTGGLLFAVPWKYHIYVETGSFSVNSKSKFLMGTKLVINEGATLNIKAETIFYDYAANEKMVTAAGMTYPVKDGALLMVNGTAYIEAPFGGNISTSSDNSRLSITTSTLSVTSSEINATRDGISFTVTEQNDVTISATGYLRKVDGNTVGDLSSGNYYGNVLNDDSGYSGAWYDDSFEFSITYEYVYNDCETTGVVTNGNETIFTPQSNITLQKPVDGNLIFMGWYLDLDCTIPVNNIVGLNYSNNIVLYGLWNKNEANYEITFNTKQTDISVNPVTVVESQLATYSPAKLNNYDSNPEKSVYFTKWYMDEACTIPFDTYDRSQITADFTLYAGWTTKEKSIVLNDQDTVVKTYWYMSDTASATVEYAFSKEGYTLDISTEGGNVTVSGNNYTVSFVSNTVTIKANWLINKYTISLNPDNGEATQDIQYEYGSTVSLPTPTRNGYKFLGWFEGSVKFTATTMPARNVTLVASWEAESSGGGCIAAGTLITLSDGTIKAVEDLTLDDKLLVFNHETGQYEAANIIFIDNDGWATYNVVNLTFSNGQITKVIYEHGFYDLTLNKYVYIDAFNYNDFIGHEFFMMKVENGVRVEENVTLTSASINLEYTGCYSPVTVYHLNYFTDNLLSMPGGIEGLFNIFEYDENMMFDQELMQIDIAKYGLYTYEDFEEYLPYEVYSAFAAPYFKVSVGKGYITFEKIIALADKYMNKMI